MNKYVVPGRSIRLASISVTMDLVGALSTYLCIIPLILLDIFVWQFQNIYFRLKEIPILERRKYVILDRYKLGKLTFWQKLNCLYCEYANGIV